MLVQVQIESAYNINSMNRDQMGQSKSLLVMSKLSFKQPEVVIDKSDHGEEDEEHRGFSRDDDDFLGFQNSARSRKYIDRNPSDNLDKGVRLKSQNSDAIGSNSADVHVMINSGDRQQKESKEAFKSGSSLLIDMENGQRNIFQGQQDSGMRFRPSNELLAKLIDAGFAGPTDSKLIEAPSPGRDTRTSNRIVKSSAYKEENSHRSKKTSSGYMLGFGESDHNIPVQMNSELNDRKDTFDLITNANPKLTNGVNSNGLNSKHINESKNSLPQRNSSQFSQSQQDHQKSDSDFYIDFKRSIKNLSDLPKSNFTKQEPKVSDDLIGMDFVDQGQNDYYPSNNSGRDKVIQTQSHQFSEAKNLERKSLKQQSHHVSHDKHLIEEQNSQINHSENNSYYHHRFTNYYQDHKTTPDCFERLVLQDERFSRVHDSRDIVKHTEDVYYDFNNSEKHSTINNNVLNNNAPKRPPEYMSGQDPYGYNNHISNQLAKPIGESSFFRDSKPSRPSSQPRESDMYIDLNASDRKKSYFMQPFPSNVNQSHSRNSHHVANNVNSHDPAYDEGPRRKNDTEDYIGMDSYQLRKHSSQNARSNMSKDKLNILELDEHERFLRANTENPNLRVEMSQGYENLKFVPNKSSRMNIANLYAENPDSFRLKSQGNQTYNDWNVNQVYGSEPKAAEDIEYQVSPDSSYIKHYLENLKQQATIADEDNYSEYRQKPKEQRLSNSNDKEFDNFQKRPSADHLPLPMRESKPKKFDSEHPNDDNHSAKLIPMYSSVPENQPAHSHINKIANQVQNDTMNSVIINQLASQYVTILEESALNLADYAHISKARMHNNKQLDETLEHYTDNNHSSGSSFYNNNHSDHIIVYENNDAIFNNDDLPKVFVKQYISNSLHPNINNKELPGIFFQKKIASSNFQKEIGESYQQENDSSNLIRFSGFGKNEIEKFNSNSSRNINVLGVSQGLPKIQKQNDDSEQKLSPLISPVEVNDSVDKTPKAPSTLKANGEGFERKIGFGNFVLSKELIIERKKKARELHPEHQIIFEGLGIKSSPIPRDDELRIKIAESLKTINKEASEHEIEEDGQKKHQTDTSFNRISLNGHRFVIPNELAIEAIRRESINKSKRNSLDQPIKRPSDQIDKTSAQKIAQINANAELNKLGDDIGQNLPTKTEVSFKPAIDDNPEVNLAKQSNAQVIEEETIDIKEQTDPIVPVKSNQKLTPDLAAHVSPSKKSMEIPSVPNLQTLEVSPVKLLAKKPITSQTNTKDLSQIKTPISEIKQKVISQTQPINTSKKPNVSQTQPLNKSPVRSRPKLHEPKQTTQTYVSPITNISRSTSPLSKSQNQTKSKLKSQKAKHPGDVNESKNLSTHYLDKSRNQIKTSKSPIKKVSPSPNNVPKRIVRSPSPNEQPMLSSNNNPFSQNRANIKKVHNVQPQGHPKRSPSPVSKTTPLPKSLKQSPAISSKSPSQNRSKSPNLIQTQPLSHKKLNHTVVKKGQKEYKRERDLEKTPDHPLSKLNKEKSKLLEMRQKVAKLKHQINVQAKKRAQQEAERLVPTTIDHYKDFVA